MMTASKRLKARLCARLKAERLALLPVPLLAVSLAGCRFAGAVADAVVTRTAETASREAPAVVAAVPSLSVVPLVATKDPAPIERVDPTIRVEFLTSLGDLPLGNLVVYKDALDRDQVNFLTWDGLSGPLLRLDPSASHGRVREYSFLLMRESARYLVLSLLMAEQDPSRKPPREFVVIDLLEQQAWGLKVACPSGEEEYSLLESVGWGQVVHRCSDEPEVVRILPVDSNSEETALPMPMALEWSSFAVWLNENELLILRDLNSAEYCIGEVDRWKPECHSLPFAIVGVSSDGIWVEIRQYSTEPPWHLQKVAMIPAACLAVPEGGACVPEWVEISLPDGVLIFPSGAMAPDGSKMLLIAAEEPRGTTPGDRPAQVISLGKETGSLTRLASIPISRLGWPVFRRMGMTDRPLAPIWSPDGEWVILEEGLRATDAAGPLYVISAQTGEIRLLQESAGNVLGSLNVP
jgi:hypothetical protein